MAQVRERDRDRYLSVLYAPAAARPGLLALHGLDLEFAAIVAGSSDAMIGEIRLAWWREALAGLDAGRIPAQPLLAVLAAQVLPAGISGAMLAGLEDRWLAMLGGDDSGAGCGGALLFNLLARLVGGNPDVAAVIGRAWANGQRADIATPVENSLRPLLGLARLAERDARHAGRKGGPEPRGSAGRQLRLLAAIAFGR